MSKSHKKMRQMFRREIRDKVDELTSEWFGGTAPVFNEKPSWCPQWLWSKLIAFIIDGSFLMKYEIEQNKKQKSGGSGESESEQDVDADTSGN